MTGAGSSRRPNSAPCCDAAGLRVADVTGLAANPLTGRWTTSRNLSVNYLVAAEA